MPNSLPNGIGGTAGDSLASAKPLLTSGAVWYVNSDGGADIGSGGIFGSDRLRPFATLGYAVGQASDGDIIALMDGHEETRLSTLSITKNLTIVGEGASNGNPTATLIAGGATVEVLSFGSGSDNSEVRNVKFQPFTSAYTGSYILGASTSGILLKGCRFEANGFNDTYQVALGTGCNNWRIVGCTFVSTETNYATAPYTALANTAAISNLVIDGCVFDGGLSPFGTGSLVVAFDNTAAAITELKGENISLLRGADVSLHASTTGYFNAQTSSGHARVSW